VSHDLKLGNSYLGVKLKHKIETATRILRKNPLEFLRVLMGRVHRWLVFSALTSEFAYPQPIEGVGFRKLSDAELTTLPPTEELRTEQLERLQRMGFNGAYGVFWKGQLAHISWLITSEYEYPRHLKLHKDEAEITASVTFPEFRGLGLYPFAIRTISRQARSCGIRRIFMKTSPINVASQRGMGKAGLRSHGKIFYFYLPYLSKNAILTLRGHRYIF
jgi:RimJ/RimL family protein N-acetyltransferase